MIIISQDEEKIVNFDNVESIEMIEFSNYIGITAKVKDVYIELGTYKDVERAKEVLKEIIKAIKGERFIEFDELKMNIHSISENIFYMPKE